MEPKTCIVFNPQANRGTAAGLLPELERCLDEHGQADLVQTTRPGEAAELAAQALEQGFERIVAAGGYLYRPWSRNI